MDSQKKRAAPKATQKNPATSDSCKFITTFSLFDDSYSELSPVGINEVARLVREMHGRDLAITRGRRVGDGFNDAPNHLALFTITGKLDGSEASVRAAVEKALPRQFHSAKFVWAVDPERRSEVSVFFWLAEPVTVNRLKTWAKVLPGSALFGRYGFSLAQSVSLQGAVGFCDGGADTVALVVDQGFDTITILETLGPSLTKTYKADGTTDSYGDAANYKVRTVEINGIKEWSAFAKKLEDQPQRCQIHGKFVGKERATKGPYPNAYPRTNANFEDQEQHLLVIDIDGYRPDMIDPVTETEDAVKLFIASVLPACFRDVSFHWQLSSSAGMPGKEDILKCHLWVWLKTPYTCAQLYEWAKVIGPQIDKAVYRRVQIRYTANPIFEEGRVDPVPQRSGFYQGASDEVDLVIDPSLLALAREQGAGEGGNDMKLVDPSEKEGLVGLFHQLYAADEVLLELLQDHGFERVTDRRYTWHEGGGTPEGVWVHDDGLHVGSSHNTWPISGIANLWDLCRVFRYGHLDKADDDFEQMDLESRGIGGLPSNLAMIDWVKTLDKVVAAQREEKTSALKEITAMIEASVDQYELEDQIAVVIQDADLSVGDREAVTNLFKRKLEEFVGTRVPIANIRRLVEPARRRVVAGDAPEWAQEWVWVNELDCFAHRVTKETVSITSFNAMYNRHMGAYAVEDSPIPKASDMCLSTWDMPFFSRAEYNPPAYYMAIKHKDSDGCSFAREGSFFFNTYRPDLLPKDRKELTPEDKRAVTIVQRHLELLIPNKSDRTHFLDYLAFCVQNPGTKIRWAPLLKGVEGDGKSAFVILLGMVMGSKNVKVLDNSTLEGSSFSGWSAGSCVIGIEEVKMHGVNRYDIFNKLKPFISNSVIDIHRKGLDPINGPNLTNYILFSNFDDAVPLTDNDRRIFFLRSPFTTKAELFAKIKAVTGMSDAAYFDDLFDFAIKTHARGLRRWLLDHPISEDFRADGRAPESESRDMIVDLSRSDDDVLVEDVISDGGLGIYPNLVAVLPLRVGLREKHGKDLNTNRIAAALKNLGFTTYQEEGADGRMKTTTVKFRGKLYTWYFRGEKPAHPGRLAVELEAGREAAQLESEFSD